MKRAICVFLSVVFVFISIGITAYALPMSAGTIALNECFVDGNGANGFDYVYFSPKKGDGDTTKYPLMVWLHGMGSGTIPREQLEYYEFSNWASDEYQSRFYNGGCYLLAVRASSSIINSWNGDDSPKLKTTIIAFINANAANIDTDRIYIGGYSTGGAMVWDMIAQFPGYFAAALPIAAIYQPSKEEMSRLGDTAIWMFSSDRDPYETGNSGHAQPTFDYLRTYTRKPESLRWTRVSDQRFADWSKRHELDNPDKITWDAEHFIWESVTYDMHMMDGVTPYVNTTTIDGTGNTITFNDPNNGVISWLARQVRGERTSNEDTSFWSRIVAFFRKIGDFFARLFSFLR